EIDLLKIENEHFKKDIYELEEMKQNYIAIQEKLEIFKNPDISLLKL
ncbi:11308_t:CDS:1, partial [Racocetra persica]